MNGMPILSLLTLLPAVGAAVVLLASGERATTARRVAMVFSLLALGAVVLLWSRFDPSVAGMQFEERHAWVTLLGAEYRVGVDGMGLLMLLLSAVVTPIAMAASWKTEQRAPLYFALVLLVESCLFGAFTALNFFHWFIFWEIGLVPAYFLIRLWGGARRAPAAMQFLVYTMVGSVGLLLAFLALFQAAHTFDFTALAALAHSNQLMPMVVERLGTHRYMPHHMAMLVFAAAFLGFAVKVPLVPFHTWLPDAYAEAPTGTTILLTGAMSKMGVYGFLRVLVPIFGAQMVRARTPLLWLAVATVVLGGFAALAQKDLKRVFAYSSVNHLGYCMLGLFAALGATGAGAANESAAAVSGVLLQMFNHGLTAATVFLCVAMIESRTGGVRGINDFGGLRKPAPVLAGLMGIALFSSLGLPGLNSFPGEFLIFRGVFSLAWVAATVSVLGLLVTAAVILTVIQKVFNGPVAKHCEGFPDLHHGERMALAPVIGLMLLVGVLPQLIVDGVNPTVVNLLAHWRF